MATGYAGQFEAMIRKIAGNTLTSIPVLFEQAGNVVVAVGKAAPVDGGAGFIKGCCFLKVDSPGRVLEIYSNGGTAAACAFTLVSE